MGLTPNVPLRTVRNTISNIPNTSSLEATGLGCLADSASYEKLDGRRRFLLKYWRSLAVLPFFLAVVISLGVFPRIVPHTAFWADLAHSLVLCPLGLPFIFILYAF